MIFSKPSSGVHSIRRLALAIEGTRAQHILETFAEDRLVRMVFDLRSAAGFADDQFGKLCHGDLVGRSQVNDFADRAVGQFINPTNPRTMSETWQKQRD